ncbi:MAG TPA: choice-of-anchor D domain-containing protein [Terriglobia bacterium]|nr:choice-of-anchor D domain-containing protein [Terriglobia bacterium]
MTDHRLCGLRLFGGRRRIHGWVFYRRVEATASIFFRPVQKGTRDGTLSVVDNAPGSPQTVPLCGVGTAVKLVPTSLSFGRVPVGTTSSPRGVTLRNASVNAALNISAFKFSGFNTGAFAETNTCGTSVPPHGSCTISVTFAPKAKGFENATLNIFDDGGASPQTVMVTGIGE